MPKLETLAEPVRQMMLTWPCIDNDEAPWTPMANPLSQARVALVTTHGMEETLPTELYQVQQSLKILFRAIRV